MKAGWKQRVKGKANRLIKMIRLPAKQITEGWSLSNYNTRSAWCEQWNGHRTFTGLSMEDCGRLHKQINLNSTTGRSRLKHSSLLSCRPASREGFMFNLAEKFWGNAQVGGDQFLRKAVYQVGVVRPEC